MAGVILFALVSVAQQADFKKLSAKERSRIAQEESVASQHDTTYQRIMFSAEEEFKQQRYDEALLYFEEAARIRPLNVYPKVKIDDLQVLIRKREEALEAAQVKEEAKRVDANQSIPLAPPAKDVIRKEDPVTEERRSGAVVIKVEEQHIAPQEPTAPEPTKTVSPSIPQKEDHPPVLPTGTDFLEEHFTEGNANVVQRTIRSNGVVKVYRKVTHSWGQVYYFLDGVPTDAWRWSDRFGEK